MDPARQRGGARATRNGKDFENMLRVPAMAMGAELLRIPDGCRTIMIGGRPLLKRVKSPFDYVLSRAGRGTAFFDAKSYGKKTIAFSDLDQHQVSELFRMAKQGNAAGYVVWFRPVDRVVWFDIRLLMRLTPGNSFGPEAGLQMGSVVMMDFKTIFLGAHP